MLTWKKTLAIGLMSGGLLVGCGDDDDDPMGGTDSGTATPDAGPGTDSGTTADAGAVGDGGATQNARVRVMHLSPDAPAVDVFANDGPTAVVSALEFPNGTDYLEVPAGSYDFDVSATGMTPADAVLSIDALALDAGQSYTAVAFDELASIQALPLVDDYEGLAAGDIRVRAIHAASAVGQVDIWNVTDAANPTPLYENVDFGVAGDALDIPAGAYTLGIDVDDDATPDLTFELPDLAAGAVVNVYAVSQDTDVFLVAQPGEGATARIDPS